MPSLPFGTCFEVDARPCPLAAIRWRDLLSSRTSCVMREWWLGSGPARRRVRRLDGRWGPVDGRDPGRAGRGRCRAARPARGPGRRPPRDPRRRPRESLATAPLTPARGLRRSSTMLGDTDLTRSLVPRLPSLYEPGSRTTPTPPASSPPAPRPPTAGGSGSSGPTPRGPGRVFVALDGELHREVALKQILDHHADDPVSRQRFLLEAEITQRAGSTRGDRAWSTAWGATRSTAAPSTPCGSSGARA